MMESQAGNGGRASLVFIVFIESPWWHVAIFYESTLNLRTIYVILEHIFEKTRAEQK